MIDLDHLYFDWLLTCLHPQGVVEEVSYVGSVLHDFPFRRRVGNDINRAVDGAHLRKEFIAQLTEANISEHVTNEFMLRECTWFEMLVALARAIDYLYDGGVEYRFVELVSNAGLESLLMFNHKGVRTASVLEFDQNLVAEVLDIIENNKFDYNGHGGLFPLYKSEHTDQREVELWDQNAAYFRERLEGVLWTSTS